jgi:hypothetical protein
MRSIILVLLLLSIRSLAASQETPPLFTPPIVAPQSKQTKAFTLPDPLTASTLRAILVQTRKGFFEPIEVTQAIIRKGGSVVPMLGEILMADSVFRKAALAEAEADTLRSSMLVDEVDVSPYLISSLEGIGTQECYDILMRSAITHTDPGVRGASLVALGNSYHDRVVTDALKPNPELVHVLLRCADDTTVVSLCQRSVAKIAREALLTWTGMELGEVVDVAKPVTVGKAKTAMSLAQYREYWWSTKSSSLVWSKNEGRFSVRQ